MCIRDSCKPRACAFSIVSPLSAASLGSKPVSYTHLFPFATASMLANRKYGKNTQHGDIKSYQYIISFDPRDAADYGLTMEKAQALGLQFCKDNFPGHPAIVCTHPDGHNHSGNIQDVYKRQGYSL